MLDLLDIPEIYNLFGTGVGIGALSGAMLLPLPGVPLKRVIIIIYQKKYWST